MTPQTAAAPWPGGGSQHGGGVNPRPYTLALESGSLPAASMASRLLYDDSFLGAGLGEEGSAAAPRTLAASATERSAVWPASTLAAHVRGGGEEGGDMQDLLVDMLI